jgi:hypothetical protein
MTKQPRGKPKIDASVLDERAKETVARILETNCQHGVLVHDCYYCSGGSGNNRTAVLVTGTTGDTQHFTVDQAPFDHYHETVRLHGCNNPDCAERKEG